MKDFVHVSPSSVDQALSVLSDYGANARVIAGGQDLLFRIKKYLVQPTHLVDLKTIGGLSYIRFNPEGDLRIGALTTLAAIAGSTEVRERYPVLAQAAQVVGSPQIRNMGTIGGNICQDVWCWYLQDGFSCWKSGGRFCDLAGGDSTYYGSIMGGHLCLSNHPSDTAPALAALDAKLRLVSGKGTRKVAILDFLSGHTWVGDTLQSHTLQPDEIVTEIEIPLRPSRSVYLKFALRKSWDFAIASAAVSIVTEERICLDARIVLGGIATAPYRSLEAEALLRSREVSEELAREVAETALRGARPLKMNRYKVDVGKALLRRALLAAAS